MMQFISVCYQPMQTNGASATENIQNNGIFIKHDCLIKVV